MTPCYACGQEYGNARNIGGATYYICDKCWAIHIKMNALAAKAIK